MADQTYGLGIAADLELLGGTVEGMDVEKLSQEQILDHINKRTEARNRAINLIMGQLSLPTTQRGFLIGQHADIGEWPKATEQDRGRRRKTAGLDAVGFPIFKFGPVRSGWTYDMLQKISNTQLLAFFNSVMAGHLEANYKEALRALFRNTDLTWTDELFAEDGSITVKPLSNGDGFIAPEWNGFVPDGTEDHYLALGTGAMSEADLEQVVDALRRYGYGQSQSVGGTGGSIVVWINDAQTGDVQGHTNFVAINDPIVRDINKIFVEGDLDEFLGYNSAARAWIKVVPYMPAGYVLAFVTSALSDGNGTRAVVNRYAPLRRRVPTSEGLRGIKRFDQKDYPLQDAWWQDFFGYGVGARNTAVVGQLAASYTVPTIS